MAGNFGRQALDRGADDRQQLVRHLLLGGEVDLRLEPGKGAQQWLPPALVAAFQCPIQLAQRLLRLGPGLGRDQVRQALDRGQIEPPVEERPPGELAGLGRAQPWSADRPSSTPASTAWPP